MCLMVYIASDKPLPLIDWNENKRAFNVTDLSKYEKNVETQFKYTNVYNAGSHLGCGCGFLKEFKEEDELALANENYLQLKSLFDRRPGKQVRNFISTLAGTEIRMPSLSSGKKSI